MDVGSSDRGSRDRNHLHAAFLPKHGFIQNAVLSVSSETGIFPDENYLEGGGTSARGGNHLLESRALLSASPADPLVDINLIVRNSYLVLSGVLTEFFSAGCPVKIPADPLWIPGYMRRLS